MTTRADMAISGFGWLELSGNIRPFLFVQEAANDDDAELTYTLTNTATGATVATGTVPCAAITAEFAAVFIGNIAPSTALAVGVTYREKWSGTVNGATVLAYRDAYASTWPMRLSMVGDVWLYTRLPILAKKPAGQTSWEAICAGAHLVVCHRLLRMFKADLITPGVIVEPEGELAIAMALEALGVFPERAAEYRARFERMMEALNPTIDTDGDGDTDKVVTQTTAGMGPASQGPAR